MGILTKLKTTKLVELQLKVFAKLGFCNLFWRIDRELDRRVLEQYNLRRV